MDKNIEPKTRDEPELNSNALLDDYKRYCTDSPKCFDCKWPQRSPVALNCGCRGGDTEVHSRELKYARELQSKFES